jgi:hypothetical protein
MEKKLYCNQFFFFKMFWISWIERERVIIINLIVKTNSYKRTTVEKSKLMTWMIYKQSWFVAISLFDASIINQMSIISILFTSLTYSFNQYIPYLKNVDFTLMFFNCLPQALYVIQYKYRWTTSIETTESRPHTSLLITNLFDIFTAIVRDYYNPVYIYHMIDQLSVMHKNWRPIFILFIHNCERLFSSLLKDERTLKHYKIYTYIYIKHVQQKQKRRSYTVHYNSR